MFVQVAESSERKKLTVRSLEGLAASIGQEFTTPRFQMEAERVQYFERATYLDVKHAAYGEPEGFGYGEGLLEGFHLLGMIDFLLTSIIEVDEGLNVTPWNYGLDHVRFVSVLRLSDVFRLRVTLSGVQTRPSGTLVSFETSAEVDDRERPGFTATFHSLWTDNSRQGERTAPQQEARGESTNE